MSTSQTKSTLVSNVEFYWAKLTNPVSPFGGDPQYELQIRFDKKRKKEMEAYGLGKIKETDDNKLAVNLKRYAKNNKGEQVAVDVVNLKNQPFQETDKIGNGTTGSVIVFQYPNSREEGKLVTRLMKVQVAQLIEYKPEPEVDFDSVTDEVDF